jgi:hypothetical protein
MKFPHILSFSFLFISLFSCFSQEEKSAITINYPTQGTVWSIPELVKLEWDVEHIDTTKSTRFFLVRDEMVVQELGSYENNGLAENIALAKNIGSGDRYQVVGIELFPNDKYNIAKFVTPFFSIVNAASDARKKEQEQASQAAIVPKKKREKRKKRPKKQPKTKTQSTPTAITSSKEEAKPDIREEFEGRKISYTKELSFTNEDISIKIWDHGRQDGDIVSIFLNGNSIVSKHYLTYWKREFKVTLDPNKSNDLFLYAHNLGDAPPNTVSIEITDGTKSENIILNSDLESCEAVMISVKK